MTSIPVRGLAVADGGLRLEVDRPELRRGRAEWLRSRILGEEGRADVTHEKRMRLILARRDLTGFQHLHPELVPDGTWSTRVTLPAAGRYRLFLQLRHEGRVHTVAFTREVGR